ncbi:glutamate receptor 1-like [Chrysoperla carnea]|uniref:glutamate receptor 1-like n=1 Tax=Chrysoperla carnea TaxID=189513 RepID=UPI001D08F1BC|nr:glutamate receptor 1-like [Chrysoperla carnea]
MGIPINKLATEVMNASLVFTYEQLWGYRIPNSTNWSGIIGQLHRKEAQIGGTFTFFANNRLPIIQYIPFVAKGMPLFIFHQPKLSVIANIYELPFNIDVWIASLLFIIVTSVTLYFAEKWEIYLYNFETEREKSLSNNIGWTEIIFMSIGAVCQQGSEFIPNRLPGRFIIIILYLGIMFLFTSYTANIVSLLQAPSSSIKTLEDLVNSRLDVGVMDLSYNHIYFPQATDRVRKKLYEKKIAPPGQKPKFLGFKEGITRMRSGLFAFYMEPSAAFRWINKNYYEHEKCSLDSIIYLNIPPAHLIIQKHLPFLEHFRIAYNRILETSVYVHHFRLLQEPRPRCENAGGGFVNVSLMDSYPVMLIFMMGIGISMCIFLLEFYSSLRMKSFKKYVIKNLKKSKKRIN